MFLFVIYLCISESIVGRRGNSGPEVRTQDLRCRLARKDNNFAAYCRTCHLQVLPPIFKQLPTTSTYELGTLRGRPLDLCCVSCLKNPR